jgi:histidyl-tRNA synthetase
MKDIFRLIDRKDKMRLADWVSYASESGLSPGQIDDLQDVLENGELWQKSEALQDLFPALEALGVSEYVRFDPKIIRGLDYYTGTVFEAQAITGDLRRSILGGGRYDSLISDVGGQPLPAVGYAMGDVVISLLLQELNLVPEGLDLSPAPILVTVFDQERLLDSLALSAELRRNGINTVCYGEPDKLARQFRYADRIGARFVAILGPDELEKSVVTVKELSSGEQQSIVRSQLASRIQEMIHSD